MFAKKEKTIDPSFYMNLYQVLHFCTAKCYIYFKTDDCDTHKHIYQQSVINTAVLKIMEKIDQCNVGTLQTSCHQEH